MASNREERIRILAYEIWEWEGHQHGHDVQHWRRATEAYEAEIAGSRFDAAGDPIEGPVPLLGRTMRTSATASPDGGIASQPVTSEPLATRKRRTKVEMVAAAAGVVSAAAAVAATLVVTKRRRGALIETASTVAPTAEPMPNAVESDASGNVGTASSMDEPPDGTTSAGPDPAADLSTGTALTTPSPEKPAPAG